jgi:hypothetical protein
VLNKTPPAPPSVAEAHAQVARVVVSACANAIASAGVIGELMRQMDANANDPAQAALFKKEAVHHAKQIMTHLHNAGILTAAFIEAGEDKPRIVTPR